MTNSKRQLGTTIKPEHVERFDQKVTGRGKYKAAHTVFGVFNVFWNIRVQNAADYLSILYVVLISRITQNVVPLMAPCILAPSLLSKLLVYVHGLAYSFPKWICLVLVFSS